MAEPKIKEVYFERVFNLGNYQTMRIGFTATVAGKQDPIAVVGKLSEETVKARNRAIQAAEAAEAEENAGHASFHDR